MNKIVKIIFIFALCLFISGLLDAQSITWERIYDGPDEFNLPDGGYDICEADSGNYYLAGYATFQSAGNRPWIIKINSFGDTIWTCVIRSIVATSAMACARSKDGGCVVTGDGTQPWVAKLDRNGNVNWLRVYPGYITRVYSIINSSDGGYAACGKTMYDSAIVFKIDSIGELDWIKVFRAGNYIRFDDISEIYNGYMLTGNISGSNSGFQFPMIFKVNKSGGFIGKKIYNEFYNSVSNSIQNINNDEYLIGGSCRDSTNTRNQGFMMRIDTSGSILFKKVFYSDYSESLNDVVIISDNRYALAYMKSMGILMFGKASIVDSAGKVYFEKEFPNPSFIEFRSVLPLSNGDIIFTGVAEFCDFNCEDIYAVRTDSTLNYKPLNINYNNSFIPPDFKLYPAYPNPFNPVTKFKFDIPKNGNVIIRIFDITGKQVNEILNQDILIGQYDAEYYASSQSSGVYFAALYFNNRLIQSQKILLIR